MGREVAKDITKEIIKDVATSGLQQCFLTANAHSLGPGDTFRFSIVSF